ncbi:MFS polyamine transporter [Mycena sp. CBHHK59/15]|nr:MFS polyamine transporter [Mycena sp. CBHHK59/15]
MSAVTLKGNNDETPASSSTNSLQKVSEPAEKPVDSAPHLNDTTILVDWDGPDDPQNPLNWSYEHKWAATIAVSSFTFISPISSSMIAPASAQLASQFGITDSAVVALTTSVFVLGYAFGPLFLAPLSELFGRSKVIQFSNLFYLVWNLACGFAKSQEQLIAFRFLAGLGGSAPLSVGGGVLSDVWRTEQRGRASAIYSLAPLLGSVGGPIAGAWIAQNSTWRWVFWSTSIADAVVGVIGLFFFQETYAPVLLEKKAKVIRQGLDVEHGSWTVQTVFEKSVDRRWRATFHRALTRPVMLFVREPIIQLLGLYMAFVYGLMYLFLTTMESIFQGIYQESVGIAGLHYIALGIGLTIPSQINSRTMDPLYVYLKNKYGGGVGRPEFRLPSMVPGTIFLPVGLLIAGWTVEYKTHWIGPDIGIVLVATGIILNFQCIQIYVLDAFTLHAASAFAAVSCLRSVCGFAFPLFAPAMYNALGFGKGNTVLAVFAIVVGCPAPWLFWHYGERIRGNSKYARKPQ